MKDDNDKVDDADDDDNGDQNYGSDNGGHDDDDDLCDLIGHEEVVSPGDVLHDVPLNLLVLQHGHTVVDEDRRLGSLEVCPENGQIT